MAESRFLGKVSVVARLAIASAVGGALVAGIALPAVGALSDSIGLRAALLSLPMIGLLGGVVLLFALFTVKADMHRLRSAQA